VQTRDILTHQAKKAALEQFVSEILDQLDIQHPGTQDTPRRVADMLLEFNQREDLRALLKEGFEHEDGNAMIIQTNIPFSALCEHHLLPFFGTADFGYVPHKRVVGLSKIARLIKAAGVWSPTLQETVTNSVADIFSEVMEPQGVIVVTHAVHACMSTRGVNAPNAITTVSAIRGIFRDVPAARAEFLSLAAMNHERR